MKFPKLPDDPSNADLGDAITRTHRCVDQNHRTVLKLIAALEKKVDGNDAKTELTFKTNAESFALWLASDTSSKDQTTALINQLATMITALGADKPKHRSLFAMSQGSAMWRIVAVVATVVIAMPLASKIVAAIWGAVSTVLLK